MSGPTPGSSLSAFRREHFGQQHAAAIARIAANMATRGPLESVLSTIAIELQRMEGMRAVQVILSASSDGPLRMMGSAGFSADPTFFGRLTACRLAGAALATDEAFRTASQVVLPDRRRSMLDDARWTAMHDYIDEIEWCDFVGTPFATQGRVKGVINCYLDRTMPVNDELLEFLRLMGDQASLAVDYHELIERDRTSVRREERQRLARDLHDSVIQSVFALGMQASTLAAVATKRQDAQMAEFADEFGMLAELVQRDLRGIVTALQPSAVAELGLQGAVDRLAEMNRRASGVRVTTRYVDEVDRAPVDMADDAYLIISEAVHNAVRHGRPNSISIELQFNADELIRLSVQDDGSGFLPSTARVGYGLASMRYRASRWGGSLDVASSESGTRIACELLGVNDVTFRQGSL